MQKKNQIIFTNGDCYIQGTPVLLEDGSECAIEKILIGERVMTKNGQGFAVKNRWHGRNVIYQFCLANGKYLGVTEMHPLLTSEGWKYAQDIHRGEQLVSWEQGEVDIIQVFGPFYEYTYNISLGGNPTWENAIVVNGFISVDYELENESSPMEWKFCY